MILRKKRSADLPPEDDEEEGSIKLGRSSEHEIISLHDLDVLMKFHPDFRFIAGMLGQTTTTKTEKTENLHESVKNEGHSKTTNEQRQNQVCNKKMVTNMRGSRIMENLSQLVKEREWEQYKNENSPIPGSNRIHKQQERHFKKMLT